MSPRKVSLNGGAAPSVSLSSAAHLQFSNRNIPLLESHLSRWKQTVAIISSRNILGVQLSWRKPASLFDN
jgi:hypothetical protein